MNIYTDFILFEVTRKRIEEEEKNTGKQKIEDQSATNTNIQ